MRTQFSKFALAAILGLAITFTLSCSSGDDGDSTCGGKLYDTGKYGCVNNELVGTCGDRYYNPEYQQCLNGDIQNGAEVTFPSSGSGEGDDGGKELIATQTCTLITYDANGGVSGTSSAGSSEWQCDSKGNQTKTVLYNADGSVSHRAESQYDSKGNMTKIVNYNADGNITSSSEYQYDSYGNGTKVVSYNAEGNITSTSRIEYDCNSDGSFCTYNIYLNDTGEISGTGEFRYTTINSKRLMASQTLPSSNGSNIKIEYEHDSRGNPTKSTYYSRQANTGNYVKYAESICTITYKTL